MLIFLRLPATIPTTLISSLFFFTPAVNAQYYPGCFMVKASGRVINLNKLCQNKVQASQKATACQGPFDKDGFPLALNPEIETFKLFLNKIKYPDGAEPEILLEIDKMLNVVEFSEKTKSTRKNLKVVIRQFLSPTNDEEYEQGSYRYHAVLNQLGKDPCYMQIMHALDRKSLMPGTLIGNLEH